MGYDLHITRAAHHVEDDDARIAPDEWRRLVEADPELRWDASYGPDVAVWNGPSLHESPWFGWEDGTVYTKNPDAPMIRKMVDLARHLEATVQGDDGETYSGDEPGYEVRQAERPPAESRTPWWRRVLGG